MAVLASPRGWVWICPGWSVCRRGKVSVGPLEEIHSHVDNGKGSNQK